MLIGHRLKEFSSMYYTLAVPNLKILHFLPSRIQFCLRLSYFISIVVTDVTVV